MNPQYYQSGIYNLPGCSSSSLTHALLITGYGTYNNYDYWLLKNRYLLFVSPWIRILLNLLMHLSSQLGFQLGDEWLHYDVKKQVQPVWYCNRCLLPNSVVWCLNFYCSDEAFFFSFPTSLALYIIPSH